MSADYGLVPTPYSSAPAPEGKNAAFASYRDAGVDTAEMIIRGGTHFEFSYIANPAFTATLRGMDMAAWYTAAWLDKYLQHDLTADARLTTNRWQADTREARVDPTGDGNLFSNYYRSRINIDSAERPGARIACDDLRAGCGILAADGCSPKPYSYLDETKSADRARSEGQTNCPEPPSCLRSSKVSVKHRPAKVKVRLTLSRKSTVTLSLRRKDGKRLAYRKRRLKGGKSTVTLKPRGSGTAGRQGLRIATACASGSGLSKRSVRIK